MPTSVASLATDDPRRAWPLYTILEASKYLGVPYSTLRSWVRPDEGHPLIESFPKEGHQATLPFAGFAEAFVLSAARNAGLRPDRIRQGVAAVRKELGIDYALATKRLYIDKAEILVKYALEDEDLTVARSKQMQITATVKNQLKLVTYGSDDFASTIVLPIFKHARVIVDSAEAFGQPIIERTGTRVRDILGLFWAEETIEDIAYDFDLTAQEVEDVIRAQTKPAAN